MVNTWLFLPTSPKIESSKLFLLKEIQSIVGSMCPVCFPIARGAVSEDLLIPLVSIVCTAQASPISRNNRLT